MKALYEHIALTLKALRLKRGWSLDKTAEETGVSKAMLGQIERQESSPTIATLWKIATGFNTSFSSFLDDTQGNLDEPIYRPGQTQNIHPSDDKIKVAPVFPFDELTQFEVMKIDLLPGCVQLSAPHQSGVIEHIIVTEGQMEVLINEQWHPLVKGEGLRFNASQPHGYRNMTRHLASIHDIIYYPQAKRTGISHEI